MDIPKGAFGGTQKDQFDERLLAKTEINDAPKVTVDEHLEKTVPDRTVPSKAQGKGKKTKERKEPAGREENPIPYCSTGKWFLTLLLMGIPVVGFIALICYSVKSKYPERKRWARAELIMTIIMFIVLFALIMISNYSGNYMYSYH